MTIQEAYEGIYDHFSQPGAKLAISQDGSCKYRTEDGLKCAVGCLITDKEYNPLMDNGDVSIADIQIELNWGNGKLNTFLKTMQTSHDQADSVEQFLGQLKDLASEYNLTLREPPQNETPLPLG